GRSSWSGRGPGFGRSGVPGSPPVSGPRVPRGRGSEPLSWRRPMTADRRPDGCAHPRPLNDDREDRNLTVVSISGSLVSGHQWTVIGQRSASVELGPSASRADAIILGLELLELLGVRLDLIVAEWHLPPEGDDLSRDRSCLGE